MVPPKIPYGGFSLSTASRLACQTGLSLRLRVLRVVQFASTLRAPANSSVVSQFRVWERGALMHHHSNGLTRFTPGALAPVRVIVSRSMCELQSLSVKLLKAIV